METIKRTIALVSAFGIMASMVSSNTLSGLSGNACVNTVSASTADMTISQNGIEFICAREGFSAKCYYDGAQSSIGYGTKCGSAAHSSGQHTITKENAMAEMMKECNNQYVPNVRRQTSGYNLLQNQFDALVSFAYNTGGGTTMIKNSPLMKFVRGEISEAEARAQYSEYVVTNSATHARDEGLVNRRNLEANLFFSKVSDPVPAPTPEPVGVLDKAEIWRVNTASGVKVRSGPGTNYDRADGGSGATNGTEFKVIKTCNGWGFTDNINTCGAGIVSGWIFLENCLFERTEVIQVQEPAPVTQKDPEPVYTPSPEPSPLPTPSPDPVQIPEVHKELKLPETNITLIEGEQYSINVDYSGLLTYKSSDTNTVLVSTAGKVTAMSAGKAIVYVVTEDSDVKMLDVTVKSKPAEISETVTGDITGDGKVDISDLSEFSIALLEGKKLTSEQLKSADVDKNGEADLADLARLKQFVSKVIITLA